MSASRAVRGERRRAVVVDQPRFVVVEVGSVADPASLEDALMILVRWALRAKEGEAHSDEGASATSACTNQGHGDST